MTESVRWLPDTAVGESPVTEDDYIEGYLSDPAAWWWTTSLSTEPADFVLPRVLAIIRAADAAIHQRALGQLGAGPLEELMSEQLLDDLKALQPFSPAMRLALSSVRIEMEPVAVQKRFETMMTEDAGRLAE